METPTSRLIREKADWLAERTVALQYAQQAEIWDPYKPAHAKSLRDAGYHFTYLAEALEAEDPQLFYEYLGWVKVLFNSLKFPDTVLPACLDCMAAALEESEAAELVRPALELIRVGRARILLAPVELPSYLTGSQPLDRLAREFLDLLLHGDRASASQVILAAVRAGTPVRDIYLHVFQRTQREIGRLWQTNQISVAQEHFCTAATQMVMSQLYPFIFTGERKPRKVVVACVGGELHEIGARMVADFFEMEGWDSYFLGANTPPEAVIATIAENKADILALSATMTFHVPKVKDLIQQLRADPALPTRVLVGGYPFNIAGSLWKQVGADGYARDAQEATLAAEKALAA